VVKYLKNIPLFSTRIRFSKMVRSFTRFDPFPDTSRPNRDLFVFHKWICTISPLLASDTFNEETWRTARPWLDFKTVRRCHYKYLEGSLGRVKCGKLIVTDAMIAKAVTYEKAINRVFDHSDEGLVKEIIQKLFEPCARPTTCRTDLMKAVNEELLARGKNAVAQSSIGWRNALCDLGLDGAPTQFQYVKMQLRKDCTDEFVQVIHLNYEPHDEKVELSAVRNTIARYLAHQNRNIAEHELAVDRAVRTTSLFLKTKTEDVVGHIRKHFAPVAEYKANRKTIIDVVNELFVPRPYDHPIWDVVFKQIEGAEHLAPKIGIDYEQIILQGYEYDSHATTPVYQVKEYTQKRVEDLFQAVFFKAAVRRICKDKNTLLPLRKRKKIPWDNIIHIHCKRGRSKHTVPYLNTVLKSMGFIPYHHTHDVWDYVHAKGVQPKLDVLAMIRKSCSVTRRTSTRKVILDHINVTYDLDLAEDSTEWIYAMTHFSDGPLTLTPN